MGLDMYLNATRFLWYSEEGLKTEIGAAIGEAPGEAQSVTVRAMYWRKANEIHAWFVRHVQDGKDECEEHDVSREQLQTLLDTITACLDDRSKAPQLLPTQAGFFFGGTDYDEYYWQSLTDTQEKLRALLANDWKGWDFSYRSS